MKFLHELADVDDLYRAVGRERKILPSLVEKDYWVMHCLWGLQQQGYQFELKGGTSLSKGFGIIERFSEDLDIQIQPNVPLKTGRNHTKPAHRAARKAFFDNLALTLTIPGMSFGRDKEFDDIPNMRSAGISGKYCVRCDDNNPLKESVLLEVGFDQTTPNEPRNLSSWAFDKAKELQLNILDNQATGVKCYLPEYTFIEKLQTISTKFRQQQQFNDLPKNFIRNYYDVYQLLMQTRVLHFIGSEDYFSHKNKRFRKEDEKNLGNNEAFLLNNLETYRIYQQEYESKSDIYYGKQPSFKIVLKTIQKYLKDL